MPIFLGTFSKRGLAIDLDMDASTAMRFHFGAMVLSVPWRAAQIVALGVSPHSLSVWQTATLMEILFHHSNVALPVDLERCLSRLVVTPRMHGIHHSIVPEETASDWSSGLTVWDWLHGTLRLNVPQANITIGVAAFRKPQGVTRPEHQKTVSVEGSAGACPPFEKVRLMEAL